MSRRKSYIRALIGALAVAAIAAPTAQAYPADMHASVAEAAAAKTQDLRSPDARDAAAQSLRGSVATTAAKTQDLRSPDARDAAAQSLHAVTGDTPVPQPIASQPVVTDSGGGSHIDWGTIGIGVLLSVVAVGGLAALAARRQRHLRVGA
jgi:hypothetical protein